jgi:predicted GNAT family acetyltransferase
MDVREVRDPERFAAEATPLLLEDEARHNLLLGIAGTLVDLPEAYPEHHLFVVEDRGRPVLAAGMTPPFNLVVSRPPRADAIAALATFLRDRGLDLPGVTGALPEAADFARHWERAAGVTSRRRMEQLIYRLTDVRPIKGVPGRMRPAAEEDRELLLGWIGEFWREALEEDVAERAEHLVDMRLRGRGGGFAVWDDGEPVSLAGDGSRTPNGVRIGPVYTPPDRRGRGYASALVAALSADLLASGRRFCFLYTDRSNETANGIYGRIGYEPVCESAEFEFTRD